MKTKILLTILVIPLYCFSDASLTKEQVKQAIELSRTATLSGDLEKAMALYDEDTKFFEYYVENGEEIVKSHSFNYVKSRYEEIVSSGDYKLLTQESLLLDIDIQTNIKQAKVYEKSKETYIYKGNNYSSLSESRSIFTIEKGRLIIIEQHAKTLSIDKI